MSSVISSESEAEPEQGRTQKFQPSHDFSYRIPKELLMKMKQSFDVFDEKCEGEIEAKYMGTLLRSLGLLPTEKEMEGILELVRSITDKADKADKVDLGTFFVVMARLLRDSGDVENAAKMALRTRLLKKGVEARSRTQIESIMAEGAVGSGGSSSSGSGGGSGPEKGSVTKRGTAAGSDTASTAPQTPTGIADGKGAVGFAENKSSFYSKLTVSPVKSIKVGKNGTQLVPVTDEERERTNQKIITDQTTITMEDLHNAIIDQSGEPLSEEDALLLERYLPITTLAKKDFSILKYRVVEDFILNNANFGGEK